MKTRAFLSLLIIVVAVAAIWTIRQSRPERAVPHASKDLVFKAKGKPESLWIVEYMDFQCASCARAATILKKRLEAQPNSLYLQVRYFPLSNHPHGLKSAVYAECAAKQGKFWEFYDLLMAGQEEWSSLDDPVYIFRHYADQVGIKKDAIEKCSENPEIASKILAQKEEAKALGVKYTPAFFIEGKMMVGAPELDSFLNERFGKLSEAESA